MPGGKQSQQQSLLDLGSYISRRRLTPEKWLKEKQITTKKALQAFLVDAAWTAAPELVKELEQALERHVEVPTATPEEHHVPKEHEHTPKEKEHEIPEVEEIPSTHQKGKRNKVPS
jgi:hypothetical protein